jgi:Holliday junction resolvase
MESNTRNTIESKIERYLYDRIKAIGGECIKINSATTRGMPDRIILRQGTIIFVETKATKGKTRLYQRYIHKRIKKQGFPVLIIKTKKEVDWLCEKLLSQATSFKLCNLQ